MIRSMTGYASAVREEDSRRAEVELRSVNHRYLKVVTRLPGSLSALDTEIEGRVRRKLQRGSVTVHLRYQDRDRPQPFRLDPDMLYAYQQQIRTFYREAGVPDPGYDRLMGLVLHLPGAVAETEESGALVSQAAKALVMEVLDEALERLEAAREEEGRHLQEVLGRHAEQVGELLDRAEARAADIPREARDRLLERVRRLVQEAGGGSVDEAEMLREVAVLAERQDVTEEHKRLRGHLVRLRELLETGGEVGRRMDFLLQELHREANTMGSKAGDAGLGHVVVELKNEIERIREQVQNLE